MNKKPVSALGAILFIVGLSIINSVEVRADERPVKLKNLPKAVQQTVAEQSVGAKILGLSKETENGKTYYEVELMVNGHHRDVLIDSTGAVVETEEEIAIDQLSPAVKATIEKQAGKGKIGVIESITRNGQVTAYEAHIKTGGKSKEIKVGTDGELIKD
jgi:uncharacterized membrane protein YkoI